MVMIFAEAELQTNVNPSPRQMGHAYILWGGSHVGEY